MVSVNRVIVVKIKWLKWECILFVSELFGVVCLGKMEVLFGSLGIFVIGVINWYFLLWIVLIMVCCCLLLCSVMCVNFMWLFKVVFDIVSLV